jgi:arylamine N-acetyltransferase
LAKKPYNFDTERKFDHALLFAFVDNRAFLIDTGFGFKSPRYPLEVDFTLKEQVYQVNDWESYKLINHGDHFVLYFFDNNEWQK